jgi:hypothetical protein
LEDEEQRLGFYALRCATIKKTHAETGLAEDVLLWDAYGDGKMTARNNGMKYYWQTVLTSPASS